MVVKKVTLIAAADMLLDELQVALPAILAHSE